MRISTGVTFLAFLHSLLPLEVTGYFRSEISASSFLFILGTSCLQEAEFWFAPLGYTFYGAGT